MKRFRAIILVTICACAAAFLAHASRCRAEAPVQSVAEIRTPKPPPTPRINGPAIFGVRPGHPFLYRIPATGERPMTFSARGLPAGVSLDPQTGQLTGSLGKPG